MHSCSCEMLFELEAGIDSVTKKGTVVGKILQSETGRGEKEVCPRVSWASCGRDLPAARHWSGNRSAQHCAWLAVPHRSCTVAERDYTVARYARLSRFTVRMHDVLTQNWGSLSSAVTLPAAAKKVDRTVQRSRCVLHLRNGHCAWGGKRGVLRSQTAQGVDRTSRAKVEIQLRLGCSPAQASSGVVHICIQCTIHNVALVGLTEKIVKKALFAYEHAEDSERCCSVGPGECTPPGSPACPCRCR